MSRADKLRTYRFEPYPWYPFAVILTKLLLDSPSAACNELLGRLLLDQSLLGSAEWDKSKEIIGSWSLSVGFLQTMINKK